MVVHLTSNLPLPPPPKKKQNTWMGHDSIGNTLNHGLCEIVFYVTFFLLDDWHRSLTSLISTIRPDAQRQAIISSPEMSLCKPQILSLSNLVNNSSSLIYSNNTSSTWLWTVIVQFLQYVTMRYKADNISCYLTALLQHFLLCPTTETQFSVGRECIACHG